MNLDFDVWVVGALERDVRRLELLQAADDGHVLAVTALHEKEPEVEG